MANIFKQNLDVTQHPSRNNFDLTHKVHGTYKFGTIYPFLCKPVVPGDSFEIDTACGFQFMPMPFPTQSNMRVIFHYFYVRNKNIWENWENFAEGLEEHTPPYIEQPAQFYKTGSLADYLDIPTSLSMDSYFQRYYPNINLNQSLVFDFRYRTLSSYVGNVNPDLQYKDHSVPHTPYQDNVLLTMFTPSADVNSVLNSGDVLFTFSGKKSDFSDLGIRFGAVYLDLWVSRENDFKTSIRVTPQTFFSGSDVYSTGIPLELTYVDETVNRVYTLSAKSFDDNVNPFYSFGSLGSLLSAVKSLYEGSPCYIFFGVSFCTGPLINSSLDQPSAPYDFLCGIFDTVSMRVPTNVPSTVDISDFPEYCPYYFIDNTDDTVKISALPFRAYESIYNAYYRNTVTQPFTINGQKRYNRYNTNLGDGADTFDYKLMQRNWELDAYTSCLPSPQQGNAPLVGMNLLGDVTIEDENGITTAKYQEDGGEGKVVVTSPLASVTHGRILMDLAQSGISINDFRQCNALQRYLEQNIRSGYKYIDYIAGQFGVRPKYNELDMPEFIGGFTQRVDVGMISNTNGVIPSDSDAFLGSYAGQAKAFGGSPHLIKHYCDDYGFLVGVMMVVPDGAYSQVLPKHFLYNKQLDWYIPLFSEIGMQPVTYEELCPIQSHFEHRSDASKRLQDTFGYQRPNHELVWYPDTVHGEFRLSLRDYLINRVFKERPELGNDFLIIKPEETNSIFNRTEPSEDVIIGQIVCKITAKRPVPRIVIPSLGR